MASQKTANFLNNSVFGHAGPIRAFASTLGATGQYQSQCLLEQYLTPGYSKPIFPLNDNDVAGGPLVKGRYHAERHLAIGLLRVFDAKLNSAQAGCEPVFDWHDKQGQHMLGVGSAAVYGPLSTYIWDASLSALCPKYKALFDAANTAEGVSRAVSAQFNR
jgi:hypothetical protein